MYLLVSDLHEFLYSFEGPKRADFANLDLDSAGSTRF